MEERNIENIDFENEDTLKGFKKFESSNSGEKKEKRSKKKKDRNRTSKIFYTIIDWLIALGIAIILTLLITSVISQGKISGRSMNPTYQNGEHILVQRSFYKIERGDVITFWAEKQENSDDALSPGPIRKVVDEIIFHQVDLENKELHIKRVVGIPGDHIIVKNKILSDGNTRTEVYVNDEIVALSESKITSSMDITLGDDQYFVIGDNYDNSYDSRYHGPIKKEDVFGKVINGRPNARKINEDGTLSLVEDTES